VNANWMRSSVLASIARPPGKTGNCPKIRSRKNNISQT